MCTWIQGFVPIASWYRWSRGEAAARVGQAPVPRAGGMGEATSRPQEPPRVLADVHRCYGGAVRLGLRRPHPGRGGPRRDGPARPPCDRVGRRPSGGVADERHEGCYVAGVGRRHRPYGPDRWPLLRPSPSPMATARPSRGRRDRCIRPVRDREAGGRPATAPVRDLDRPLLGCGVPIRARDAICRPVRDARFVLGIGRSPGAKTVLWSSAAVVALVVGASRIYLGAHWMTDVLGGYALGATWVAAVVIVALVTSPQGTSGADAAGERASCGRRGNRRSERPDS